MGQITIRGLSVDLPALDEDTELDQVCSAGDLTGLVSDFEFARIRVSALELKDVTLAGGQIRKVRAGKTSMTGTHVRSVEFAGCKMDYAMLSGIRAAGPVIFAACSFREADATCEPTTSPR